MKLFVCLFIACALVTQILGFNVPSNSETEFEYRRPDDEDYNERIMNDYSSNQNQNTLAGAYPLPYYGKIEERMAKSTLSMNTNAVQQVRRIADEKFNMCVVPGMAVPDRHCLGRITGQMMQLIAALENSYRPMAGMA